MATAPLRRVVGILTTLLLATLFVAGTAGAADAADGYKYWNYFHVQDGSYAFAQTGPSDVTPKDGTVEAYRYGLSSTADGLPPRAGAGEYSVDDLCAGLQADTGQKRVGVLIDYGTAEDAEGGQVPAEPRGACAVVPAAATGQQVLDAVADVRVEGGLTCGIDGYPVKGCSVTVKNAPAPAAEQNVSFALPQSAEPTASAANDGDDDGGPAWPLIGVAAAVVVIGGGALGLARRSKNA